MAEKDDLWLLGYGADEDPLPPYAQDAWREGADVTILWESIRFLARQVHDLREQGVKLEVPAQTPVPYLDHN